MNVQVSSKGINYDFLFTGKFEKEELGITVIHTWPYWVTPIQSMSPALLTLTKSAGTLIVVFSNGFIIFHLSA